MARIKCTDTNKNKTRNLAFFSSVVWVSTSLPASGREGGRRSFGSCSQPPCGPPTLTLTKKKTAREPGDLPAPPSRLRAVSARSKAAACWRGRAVLCHLCCVASSAAAFLPAHLQDSCWSSASPRACCRTTVVGHALAHGGLPTPCQGRSRLPRRLHCSCRQFLRLGPQTGSLASLPSSCLRGTST